MYSVVSDGVGGGVAAGERHVAGDDVSVVEGVQTVYQLLEGRRLVVSGNMVIILSVLQFISRGVMVKIENE